MQRYLKVEDFRPETFWFLHLELNRAGSVVKFSWKRPHQFDFDIANSLFARVTEDVTTTVVKVIKKETKKWYASWPTMNSGSDVVQEAPPIDHGRTSEGWLQALAIGPKEDLGRTYPTLS